MMRNALILLAAGTAIVFAAPLAAQAAGQDAAGPAQAAQPPAAATTATAPATADDPAAKASDAKAKTKADATSSCGTVVKAGPNAGQVLSKCKKDSSSDAAKAKDSDQPH
jgi:hypothetical protein